MCMNQIGETNLDIIVGGLVETDHRYETINGYSRQEIIDAVIAGFNEKNCPQNSPTPRTPANP